MRKASISTFNKWKTQFEREHNTLSWLCCDVNKDDKTVVVIPKQVGMSFRITCSNFDSVPVRTVRTEHRTEPNFERFAIANYKL